MDPNHELQNQQEKPKPSPDMGTGPGREPKAPGERFPPAVLAAIVTGVFALITALVGSYFPNKVRMDELRLAATQTAEARAIQITQAAGWTATPSPATPGSLETAVTATLTFTPVSPAQGISANGTATRLAEGTGQPPTVQAPTATPSPTETPGSTPTDTATPPPASTATVQPTDTATPVPTATPTVRVPDTPTVAPTSTPAPPPVTDMPLPTKAPSATPTSTATPGPTGAPEPAKTDTVRPLGAAGSALYS